MLTVVVAGTIIKSSHPIKLNKSVIFRDVGFYIFSTVIVIIYGCYGELNILTSVLMLAIYALLVVVVLIQNKMEKMVEERKEEEIPIVAEIFVEQEDWETIELNESTILDKRLKAINSRKNILRGLIFYMVDFPFKMIRKVTLPPCEEEEFQKFWALVSPIPFFLFNLITLFPHQILADIAISIPSGLLLMAMVHYYSTDGRRPKWFALLGFLAIIGGLVWTFLASSILIDLLQFYGVFLGLEEAYLGLSVLAIGNALPDALTTISLSKQGYAVMGISGGYAGQLFGLLVGFGVAMLKQSIIDGPQLFDIFNKSFLKENILPIIVLFTTLLTLVLTFTWGIIKNYYFERRLAYTLSSIYFIFITVASYVAIRIVIEVDEQVF